MTPAYCGDACRAQTRRTPCGQTIGASLRAAHLTPEPIDVNDARANRAERLRLARLGACIGCGESFHAPILPSLVEPTERRLNPVRA